MEVRRGNFVGVTDGEAPPTFGVPTRASLGSPVEESPPTRSDPEGKEAGSVGKIFSDIVYVITLFNNADEHADVREIVDFP